MTDTYFDYLTGTVTVPAAAPEEWRKDGLGEFYRAPNDARWGQTLCRVLYHESVHFWQFFSSAYIANLVSDDWRRLEHYEKTGEVLPLPDAARRFDTPSDGQAFSPRDLVECWARYWDLHTRGPAAIIKDEGVPAGDVRKMEIRDPFTGITSYTHEAYDYLMQKGRDSTLYERPYRWLLQKTGGHSAFVAISFPILAHAAFGCPDPVTVFHAAFETAWSSAVLRAAIDKRCGNINLDWLNQWSAFLGEAARPVLRQRGMPAFTSGFDVIQRGALGAHPIYREYLEQAKVLQGHVTLNKRTAASGPPPDGGIERFVYAVADMAYRDPWVVFGLPGQPDYRYMLGMSLAPIRVRFRNYELVARRPPALRLMEVTEGQIGEETYEAALADLDARVARFRNADFAVSRGLPADAFEAAAG